jgi:membrane protein CcdC involved in cytochrome C biogenesis
MIGFTAMGLFKINSNTILSVFAVILSYSVVLIQTSEQS